LLSTTFHDLQGVFLENTDFYVFKLEGQSQ
jgi:hypothetical protein